MEISQEKYQELMEKAEKWDALEEAVRPYYFDDNGNYIEDDEEMGDGLIGIGEIAASMLGYL